MPRHSRSYDPFGDAAFDVTVTGMLPGRPYRWRARVAYGEASGPWSDWTRSHETGTNGAPPAIEGLSAALVPRAGAPPGAPGLAHVVVPRQTDDGGDPIVGILVRARHADGVAFDGNWRRLGSFPAGDVDLGPLHIDVDGGLLPSHDGKVHAYEFSAACYNRLGVGAWSAPSPALATPLLPAGARRHVVDGHGAALKKPDKHHLGDDDVDAAARGAELYGAALRHVSRELDELFDAHAHAAHGPLALATGEHLEIWTEGFRAPLREPQHRADAWLCHWSPPHVSVAAELVAADPLLGDGPLANAPALAHRIAFMKRGAVPFVSKALAAQRAGALALVVADDGDCDGLDQYCVPGGDRARGEGFARLDLPRPWLDVHIPVLLVLADDAAHILEHFPVSDGAGGVVPASHFPRAAAEEEDEYHQEL